jgi:hypothetical protein
MFFIEQEYFICFFFLSIVDNRALVEVDIQTIVELAAAAVAVDMDRLDMVLKLTRRVLEEINEDRDYVLKRKTIR